MSYTQRSVWDPPIPIPADHPINRLPFRGQISSSGVTSEQLTAQLDKEDGERARVFRRPRGRSLP